MTVSIVIAVKADNPNLRKCIESCLNLKYSDFEILVLPDKDIELNYPKTHVIPTGSLTPPKKRDIAIDKAKGDIIAFLDDDAYPQKDWLDFALRHFSDNEIAAVGGPAVTPDSDTIREKASGRIYSSFVVSGPYVYRYSPKAMRFVDDYPSCNLFVRKSVLREIGGFDASYWPGEDTFLCLKITKDLHKKIMYDPKVLVYHHRRKVVTEHLKQIANYALHRGYFVKRFPGNSLKIAYFMPSLFTIGLFIGLFLSFFLGSMVKNAYLFAIISYLLFVFIYSISKDFRLTILVFWGTILSHIAYGLYFIKGLVSQRLKEE